MHQQGLFLREPGGEFGGQKVIYWLVEPFLVEVDVYEHEHRWGYQVGCLREG